MLDFAYPPHCAVCAAEIAAAEVLCAACWAEIAAPAGAKIAGPVVDPGAAYEGIVVWGEFVGVLQQAIYAVKFHNQPRLGRALGRRMGQCLARDLAPVDCLLPVPLHPARLRERGYN